MKPFSLPAEKYHVPGVDLCHNLHIHTNKSDGRFSMEEIYEAVKFGDLVTIGYSDHAFSSKGVNALNDYKSIKEYLDSLNALKEKSKKEGILKVLGGLEIDLSKSTGLVDPKKLPFNLLDEFDYLLFENLNVSSLVPRKNDSFMKKLALKCLKGTKLEEYFYERPLQELVDIRENFSHAAIGLAHPDLEKDYGKYSSLAETLGKNKIFIDINQSEFTNSYSSGINTRNGKDYYKHFTSELIKELIFNNVQFVIGTDFHGEKSGIAYLRKELNNIKDAQKFIEGNNLKLHPLVRIREHTLKK